MHESKKFDELDRITYIFRIYKIRSILVAFTRHLSWSIINF